MMKRPVSAYSVSATVFVAVVLMAETALAECSIPSLLSNVTMNSAGTFSHAGTQWFVSGAVTGDFSFSGTSRACKPDFVSFVEWDGASIDWIDEPTWSDKGHSEPCFTDKMYARFLIANYVLGFSHTDNQNDGTLDWGLEYAMENLEDVTGVCSWQGYIAKTQWSPAFVGNEFTNIPKNFVYHHTPVVRAGVLFHETRHTENYPHDGNDGSNRCPECVAGGCPGGVHSCDEYFGSSQALGGAPGADSYEVTFQIDYVTRGVLRSTSTPVTYSIAPLTQRRSGQRWGNYVLANRFDNAASANIRISGLRAPSSGTCTYPPAPPFFNICPTTNL